MIRSEDPPRDISTSHMTAMLSPDGTKLIAPHIERNPTKLSIREYDLATGTYRNRVEIPSRTGADGKPSGIGIERFVLSPDGTLLVEGRPSEAYVWDLATGQVRHHVKCLEKGTGMSSLARTASNSSPPVVPYMPSLFGIWRLVKKRKNSREQSGTMRGY
jgi:hypothetical protein